MLLTKRLLKELNIHYFAAKQTQSQPTLQSTEQEATPVETPEVQLDKNEFRLLVKMLQAINHELQTDLLYLENNVLMYPIKDTTLVFDDVNLTDSPKQLHLASLQQLLHDPTVKRPVWEKLKTLQ
ncbi:hypothetical protein [Marinicella sp. W31]|uniref:hypothetical protein n=1 Tax=Marinicella sp. W31 TaxID=3023713 RepID=UPI003757C5F3